MESFDSLQKTKECSKNGNTLELFCCNWRLSVPHGNYQASIIENVRIFKLVLFKMGEQECKGMDRKFEGCVIQTLSAVCNNER